MFRLSFGSVQTPANYGSFLLNFEHARFKRCNSFKSAKDEVLSVLGGGTLAVGAGFIGDAGVPLDWTWCDCEPSVTGFVN